MMIEFTTEVVVFNLHQGESKSTASCRYFEILLNLVVDSGCLLRLSFPAPYDTIPQAKQIRCRTVLGQGVNNFWQCLHLRRN